MEPFEQNTEQGQTASGAEGAAAAEQAAEEENNGTEEATAAVVELSQNEKMVNATMELLRRHNAKGIDGEVGVYDAHVIADACEKLYRGAVHADSGYGIVLTRLYFETANLL